MQRTPLHRFGATRRTLLVLTAAAGLAAASPAGAASVSVKTVRDADPPDVLRFRADPGELNAVEVLARRAHQGTPLRIRVADLRAELAPGPGCGSAGRQAVECRGSSDDEIEIDARLGDGDDQAELRSEPAAIDAIADVRGGAGADRIAVPAGGTWYGNLYGNTGNDVILGEGLASDENFLDGGPGADRIVGSPHADYIREGDRQGLPSADSIDGGGGPDLLSYRRRTRPLRIDVGAGRAGEPGEGDRFRRVEYFHGGEAGDVLVGGAHRDFLNGGGGPDRVFGRGGGDVITVGPGDTASGGPGSDWFGIYGPGRVSCGAGKDTLLQDRRPGAGPILSRDCDFLWDDPTDGEDASGLEVRTRPKLSRGGRLRLRLLADETRAVVRVTGVKRPFSVFARGRARLRLPAGQELPDAYARGRVTIDLPKPLRERLRRRAQLLRFDVRTPSEHAVWITWVGPAR
jgi:hypothetical protein